MKVDAGILVLATLVACAGQRGATVQAPVDVAIAPLGGLPAPMITSTGERSTSDCSIRLAAARIEKSSPGCYLDEHISHGPGLLQYPCDGDGLATADFGEHHYEGQIERGEVHVVLSTELDWEDGCRWGTQASISGTVTHAGEPTLGKLSWQYLDHVISGSGCSGVCRAKASMGVTSTKPKVGRGNPSTDDDDDLDHH
jgi:hypothetical protein